MALDEKKDYTIEFEDRDGYLSAVISGEEDSVSIALEYWRRVIDECNKRGFKALLVEEDFPNQPSMADMFTVTSAIPKMGSGGLKIAFVDRESDHNDLNIFGETVAVNRGLNARVFANVADAEKWLKS